MGEATIIGSKWKEVEVGRILYIPANSDHPYAGRIAAIVEIIDHKRALVDGPAKDPKLAVPRQPISFAKTLISPLVIETLPRGARTGTVRAAWEKADIDAKWAESAWAKSAARSARRKALTDFDRFKLMRLKKRARHAVRVQLAKTK